MGLLNNIMTVDPLNNMSFYCPFIVARMIQLCQQLNLLSGVSFHEKAAGSVFLTEQDQAM